MMINVFMNRYLVRSEEVMQPWHDISMANMKDVAAINFFLREIKSGQKKFKKVYVGNPAITRH